MLIVLLLVTFIASSIGSFSRYTNYCCQYGDSPSNVQTECRLGGCTLHNTTRRLQAFFPVENCDTECDVGFRNGSALNGLTTDCQYCSSPAACQSDHSFSGCSVPSAQPPLQLTSFHFASTNTNQTTTFGYLSEQSMCCYWAQIGANNQLVFDVAEDGDGGCTKDAGGRPHTSELVAFIEKGFNYDCPAIPPCANNCSGHGLCTVNQCACDDGFIGDICSYPCNDSNCDLGYCVVHPALQELEVESFFDVADDELGQFYFDAQGMLNANVSVCECIPNATGPKCEVCKKGWSGEFCRWKCADGPCNGPHMSGYCADDVCLCAEGWQNTGSGCDKCALGFGGANCTCDSTKCGVPSHSLGCSENGTCLCVGQWGGEFCQDCGCLNRGNCSDFSGVCDCPHPFTGPKCDECEPPFYNIEQNCQVQCLPDQCGHTGSCNTTTGLCDCPNHTAGDNCTHCEPNYYGFTCGTFCDANITCSGVGTCNNITGFCDCPPGFAGDCTQCADGFYPSGTCNVQCDQVKDCNAHGKCNDQGKCVCSSSVLYTDGNCELKIWVIIVPCVLLLVIVGAFYGGVVWYKRKNSYDDWGEPLLY